MRLRRNVGRSPLARRLLRHRNMQYKTHHPVPAAISLSRRNTTRWPMKGSNSEAPNKTSHAYCFLCCLQPSKQSSAPTPLQRASQRLKLFLRWSRCCRRLMHHRGALPKMASSSELTIHTMFRTCTIFQWNARGLRSKLSDFRQLVRAYHFPFIVISESRVGEHFRMPGYYFLHSERPDDISRLLMGFRKDIPTSL